MACVSPESPFSHYALPFPSKTGVERKDFDTNPKERRFFRRRVNCGMLERAGYSIALSSATNYVRP